MRKLTISRKKSFVACLTKLYLYIEVKNVEANGKTYIVNNKNYICVGIISNGKTLTVEIPNESIEIMICWDKNSFEFGGVQLYTTYSVPHGDTDVILYTEPSYSPEEGNPFIIKQLK